MSDNNTNFTEFDLPSDSYAAFDATSLKRLMIDRLDDNAVFTDQNFEGSNLSSMIDIIAYSYHVLLFYLNQTSTETLFSESQLYENMNRIVKSIDYSPTGFQTSNLSFSMAADLNIGEDTYVLPRYAFLRAGGVNFSLQKDIVFTKSIPGAETITSVGNENLLYQGLWREYPVLPGVGEPFETISLVPGEDVIIDHFNIDVYIQDVTTKKWREWRRVDTLYLQEADSEVYEVRLNENKHYEIKFGNNITGKQLKPGDIISIFYLESDGEKGQIGAAAIDNSALSFFNNVRFLEIFTSVKAPNSLYLTEVQCRSLKFMNRYGSTTFYKGETVSDIRERAPKTFTSQYRLINSTDYENYLKHKFSNIIKDVKVVNNKDYVDGHVEYLFNDLGLSKPNDDANTLYNQALFANSCDFNNVYIYAVPRLEQNTSYIVKNNYLTAAQKSALVDSLRENKVLTSQSIIIDPVYVAVDIGVVATGEKYTSSIKDLTELKIIRKKNSRVSKDNIKKQASEIIKNFFKGASLGQTINFASITNDIAGINGVSSLYTVRTDTPTTKIEGVNFLLWNPVYPTIDVQTNSSIVVLPFFKYPYLNDADNFINKISVVSEGVSVY